MYVVFNKINCNMFAALFPNQAGEWSYPLIEWQQISSAAAAGNQSIPPGKINSQTGGGRSQPVTLFRVLLKSTCWLRYFIATISPHSTTYQTEQVKVH
jgi:hypothetical protein